jgi:FkbM family methyltransferase
MINWAPREPKRNAFSLLATDHGAMIVNRFDWHIAPDGGTFGVSAGLLNSSSFDPDEMNLMIQLLTLKRHLKGDGVVMLDGGANIGAHSLVAGRQMTGWGQVIAVEAQERLFYCLAGNITLNNLFNVTAKWKALGMNTTTISIPVPDYLQHASFGSLELQQKEDSEDIGQKDFTYQFVDQVTVDSLNLDRLDFFKLDVEGMEEQVLFGSTHTINKCRPIIHVENLKSDCDKLHVILENFGYQLKKMGPNTLAIHKDDPAKEHIQW